MKTYIRLLIALLISLPFFSCSEESMDTYNDSIVGVWVRTENTNSNYEQVHELTFSSNTFVKSVIRTEYKDEQGYSGARIYNWREEGGEVIIEDDEGEFVYTINTENQPILEAANGWLYYKVSDKVENF